MIAKIVIIGVLLLIVSLIIAGGSLILGWWEPMKDADGKTIPLTAKEKVGVGFIFASMVVGLLTLLFSSDHPWVKKIKGQRA